MQTAGNNCTIDRRVHDRVLEFAAFRWPQAGDGLVNGTVADWPINPGAVQRDDQNRAMLLHFAPGRVLAPDPSAATEALLNAAAAQGMGNTVDVTGKWDHYVIDGPDAARLLACAIDSSAALDKRECAAVVLFDCPAVIARLRSGFELWLQASYSADFLATADGFRAALRHPTQRP